MMKTFYTQIFFFNLILIYACSAQERNCNKFTLLGDKFKKMIPKDFCMPKGYKCYYFINDVDLTADGKNDLIIHWDKSKLKDGDTTFVSIYQKVNDSLYLHKVTLSNLYPIYLEDYSMEYAIEHPYKPLVNKQTKLEGANLFKVEFKKNVICIELFTEAQAGVNLHFTYNSLKKNWYLSKEVYWFGDNLRIAREIKETKFIKNGISINKFDMFNYLE